MGCYFDDCTASLFRFAGTESDKGTPPASKMLLFRPPFAAAPLGKAFPFSSCSGLGRFVMLSTWRSSNTTTAFSFTSFLDCLCRKSFLLLRTFR